MRRLLFTGAAAGAIVGALAGVFECVFEPLAHPVRVPYTIGANGLFGAGLGVAAALAVSSSRRRRDDFPAGGGAVVGLVMFVPLAAALGLLANRVLLRGTHFLSPVSLAADAACLVIAAVGAALLGRAARSLLARRPLSLRPALVASGVGAAVLAALVLVPVVFVARGAPDPSRPSVVLVSIDTLRPDRLSSGGDPRGSSPEIDRLCREGVLFSEAVAASPGSAASHAALLTSRYPISNGVWANFTILDESVTTIAETLRAAGYRTGAFVTNTFLGRRFGFDQGFDTYVESGRVQALTESSPAAFWRSLALVQIVDRLRVRLAPGYDPSFETALRWVRESDRPFLFFVHLMDVHSPYVPPHPYGPRYGATPEGWPGAREARNKFGWRPSEEAYVAEIRFADAKIGRLRRTLQRIGVLDEAIVILTSDHGENLLDHEPHFSHGNTLYDSTLRVLSAFRAPRLLKRTGLDARLFENVDVLPCLASLLGAERGADWEGRSLFTASPPSRAASFCQLDRDFAVRTPEWKVIVPDAGVESLLRLDEDPGELDLRPAPEEERALARAGLAAWFEGHVSELYDRDAAQVRPEELSPETIEKLRALGYLD